jgi:predicted nucleotidyltransferase
MNRSNMLPMKTLPFLRATIERLATAFAPERIVLFGSYAKGTARPESDVDLLVIADMEGDSMAYMRYAHQLVAASFPPIDIVLCTPEDVAEARAAQSPFLLSVLGSGITVYSRS